MSPHLPQAAVVVDRTQESPDIFTLRLAHADIAAGGAFRFAPGQFNMLYLFGVGEVPISIVSDPEDLPLLGHTIRAVGRVTRGLAGLETGQRLGLRGPYGRGWPLDAARGRDLVIVTGGLGCAPVVAVIDYVLKRRAEFGRLTIIQGVKHSADLLWRHRYAEWSAHPDTEVLLAADVGGPQWPWHVGRVTDLIDGADLRPEAAMAFLCGPEPMMGAAVDRLLARGLAADRLYLSLERNMQCALGQCGHCQYGPRFVCRDGPVFAYPDIRELFGVKGF